MDNRLEYGVLKGTVGSAPRSQAARHHGKDVHFHLHLDIDFGVHSHWDIAVNVGTDNADDLLMYRFVDPFQHPITTSLERLPAGFTALDVNEGSPALDLIRSDVLPGGVRTLTANHAIGREGPTEVEPFKTLSAWMAQARQQQATVYVFGHPYNTGYGVHDIHLNQGSRGGYLDRGNPEHNDVWEDGAVLVQFPDRWAALFTAFSSQAVPTDDQTGNPLPGSTVLGKQRPDRLVGS